jgi:hypothetical protein
MSDDKISALLNDDRYESKDWKQADLVGRIEWLIIMLEAKCEEVDKLASIINKDLVHRALDAKLAKAMESLVVIDALDPVGLVDGCSNYALKCIVLRMGEIARATLAELKGEQL